MSVVVNVIDKIDVQTPAHEIAHAIQDWLDQDFDVLWLVSGGSALDVAVAARDMINLSNTLGILKVGLIDERYGEEGWEHSNWQQLLDKGFDMTDIVDFPVLTGFDKQTTASNYSRLLKDELVACNYVIGLVGMGADGHTSGLLPENPVMNSQNYVDTYDGPDYQRITTTPLFLELIDTIFLYAVGEAKWPKLQLLNSELSSGELPVKVLKRCDELVVYTDYTGEM
jgi:6-phosphogluconolactonase/glucosamine-6-phosphate isomerase/deaminase